MTTTYQEPTSINADLSRPAMVDSAALGWVPSPLAGVHRRMLERDGGEVARATSIVRYAADSRFSPHEHPKGEEYLVLSGTFSDEHGDFAAGTYVRNPPGSRHAPFSKDGCIIFVKLRQMRPEGEPQIAVRSQDESWQPASAPDHWRITLFDPPDRAECVTLERLNPGAVVADYPCDGGEEILVLDGTLSIDGRTYSQDAWLRFPHGTVHGIASATGCRLWVKRGHLGGEG